MIRRQPDWDEYEYREWLDQQFDQWGFDFIQEPKACGSRKRIDYILKYRYQDQFNPILFGVEVKRLDSNISKGKELGEMLKQAQEYSEMTWNTHIKHEPRAISVGGKMKHLPEYNPLTKEPSKIMVFVTPAISEIFCQIEEAAFSKKGVFYVKPKHDLSSHDPNINSLIYSTMGVGELRFLYNKYYPNDQEKDIPTFVINNQIVWKKSYPYHERMRTEFNQQITKLAV